MFFEDIFLLFGYTSHVKDDNIVPFGNPQILRFFSRCISTDGLSGDEYGDSIVSVLITYIIQWNYIRKGFCEGPIGNEGIIR